jgi:hypothetical protein
MVMSWQYIAGFFDGEGSIATGAGYNSRRVGIYIAQSGDRGLWVLTEIQKFLADCGIKSSVFATGKIGKNGMTKQAYRLGVCGFISARDFLVAVFPYLYIKKTFAQDVLRYDKLFPSLMTTVSAASWRRENQAKRANRGAAWHAKFDGKVTGRPKGSKDKGPRRPRASKAS